jgi:DNA-binding MarR family transcriptional regulator
MTESEKERKMPSAEPTTTTDQKTRDQLLEAFGQEMRQLVAETVVFNQAVADRLGLHPTDLQCLNILTNTGPVTAGQLGAQTGLTTGAVTRLVDRLEQAGYVRRERDTADRRRVTITPVWERLADLGRLYGPMGRAWSELLAGYSDQELALFVDLLGRSHPLTRGETAKLRAGAGRGR